MKILGNSIRFLIPGVMKAALVVVMVATFILSVCAQEVLWNELNNKVTTLSQQSRYTEALNVAKEALKIAEDTFGPGDSKVAVSLNKLAGLYIIKGSYAEIEPLYKHVLEIHEKAFGSDSPDVAISLNNLAELYYNQGRYKEAAPLYERSLQILEETLGPDHPEVIITREMMEALLKKINK